MAGLSEHLVFFLLILTSVGIWLWSDALTVEVPYLVPFLPEGWRLGSYLVLMKGVSTCFLFLLPLFLAKGVIVACSICFTLGCLFSMSLIFSWDIIIYPPFAPNGLSIGFLGNAFMLMGLDSVRMTLIYMLATELFAEKFITAVLIGDALGGLFASGVSYVQGYKQFAPQSLNSSLVEPLLSHNDSSTHGLSTNFVFGPQDAIIAIAALFCICFISFVLVVWNQKRDANIAIPNSLRRKKYTSESTPLVRSSASALANTAMALPADVEDNWEPDEKEDKDDTQLIENESSEVEVIYGERQQKTLYFIWFLASGSIFTLMPAFHSFSSIPYSQTCFILSVSGWSLAIPCTSVFAHYFRIRKVKRMLGVAVFHVMLCLCLLYISSQSPNPPLKDSWIGEVIVVCLWALQGSSGFYMFSVASYSLREVDERAVKWGSVCAQLGDVAGAAISFSLVNFTHLFNDS